MWVPPPELPVTPIRFGSTSFRLSEVIQRADPIIYRVPGDVVAHQQTLSAEHCVLSRRCQQAASASDRDRRTENVHPGRSGPRPVSTKPFEARLPKDVLPSFMRFRAALMTKWKQDGRIRRLARSSADINWRLRKIPADSRRSPSRCGTDHARSCRPLWRSEACALEIRRHSRRICRRTWSRRCIQCVDGIDSWPRSQVQSLRLR